MTEHTSTLAAYQAWVVARRKRIAKTPKPQYTPTPEREPIYTEREAAEYTGLARCTIGQARQKGHLHPDPHLTKAAQKIIYTQTELDRWTKTLHPHTK